MTGSLTETWMKKIDSEGHLHGQSAPSSSNCSSRRESVCRPLAAALQGGHFQSVQRENIKRAFYHQKTKQKKTKNNDL